MKTRIIIPITAIIAFSLVVTQAFASCAPNEDWPDAPCFDTLPANRDEYREKWAPYYDYKGSEFMEAKKAELLQAIKDGTFMEWEDNAENSNVYQYYHSVGLVPNQYEYFFFEDEALLSPLQQFRSGVNAEEIQCKTGLERTIKINDFDRFYCVSPDTKQILIKRGWAFDDSKACRNPIDCADSGISLDRTVYPPSELIVDANNQFALDFYSYVTKDKDENIFFSPTSISTAFAIAYEGAQGNTAKEMEGVFGFDPDDEQRRSEFANMQNSLNPADQKFKLRIANALWLAQGFEPLSDYVDVTRTYYDSKVDTVDFASDEAINTINGWVDTKTEGKIEKLFEQLDPNTQLVITNAIYFKGNWTLPFDKDRTRDADFMINPQKTVQVPTMSRDFVFNYTSDDQVQVLELPYQGDRLSMLILLPNEIDGLDSLEDSLTVEKMEQWKSKLSEQRLFIQIPKFKLETNYDLKASLPEIGMPSAFSISDADFSGITGSRGLYIEQAIHKAFVDVNEEGTEAAAATGIVMDESMPPEFRADHPFMFLIQDNETEQILFMGRMADPTK